MRVLHAVLSGKMAGGQKVCLDLIRDQVKRGYEVILSSPSDGPVIAACPREVTAVFHSVERVSRPWVLWSLVRFLRHARPDLIHTHVTVSGNILWRIAGWYAGVPVINHIHIRNYYRPNSLTGSLARWLDNITAQIPTRMIAVSQDTARGLIQQGYPAQRIVVIPNGVEYSEQNEPPQPTSADSAIIGCVARLCPTKGQDLLLTAFSQLAPHYLAALWLIGEDQETGGRYEQYLRQRAVVLGVADRVIFWGHCDNVRAMMREMDMLVLPSFDEAMPLVLLEAMAEGRPVVATRVGGVHEVVDDGVEGLLIQPGDESQLVTALVKLLDNRQSACRMGQAGRDKARERFSITRMLRDTDKVCHEALLGR